MSKIEDLQDDLPAMLIRAVEKGRDMVIETLKKRIKSGKNEDGGLYGDYSRSHKSRRKKEGLQTAYKDFHYSGTLFNHFEEVNRSSSANSAKIDISFSGSPYRRDDQKPYHAGEPSTNVELMKLLVKQNKGKKIIELSDTERSKIIQAVKDKFKGDVEYISIT